MSYHSNLILSIPITSLDDLILSIQREQLNVVGARYACNREKCDIEPGIHTVVHSIHPVGQLAHLASTEAA